MLSRVWKAPLPLPFLAFPEPRGTIVTLGRDPSPSDAGAAAGALLPLAPSFVVAGLAEPPGDALVPSVAVVITGGLPTPPDFE